MENYFYQEEYDDAKIDNEYDSGNDNHDGYYYDAEDYYHDDYSHDIEDYYHDGYSHDADNYYHNNHEMDNGYYSLQNDVKVNLSYQIDWECYEYETDLENVIITVNYPVITGKEVPNLDMLNARIAEEVTFFVDYFEEEYQPYLTEDGYFGVVAQGYVTCMSEEVLSIVFSETIVADYFESASLYCINMDMENGVVWNNNDLLKIDDDFSVNFRLRSEKQNGIIEGLDEMSDQELTEYLCASNLIAFYIPEGMEIGLNYDEGWVTVTYRDYENYLNIF